MLGLVLPVVLAACGGDEGMGLSQTGGHGTVSRCPDGLIEVQGGGRSVGESDASLVEAYGDNVIPIDDFAIESFCMAVYPFPGAKGDAWPVDGLHYDQVAAVESLLVDVGRRLCTVTELAYAASGKSNWRYPTDSVERIEGDCDPDDHTPQPMGSYGDCLSPFDVADFQVRSAWGRLDEDMADVVKDQRAAGLPEDHDYAAWGGTSRDDTYYAPNNFGVHFHERGSKAYTDDALRVCADLTALGEEPDPDDGWKALVADYQDAGSYAVWLSLR